MSSASYDSGTAETAWPTPVPLTAWRKRPAELREGAKAARRAACRDPADAGVPDPVLTANVR